MSELAAQSNFAPTRWTLVLRARGKTAEARAALGELCEIYYEPVFAFLRREGRTEDASREAAQEFFARILTDNAFEGADQARGRFRSYLLGALKHFLAEQRAKAQRQKRGGGAVHESLDAAPEGSDEPLQVADHSLLSPDALFDRTWALALMRLALDRLQAEMTAKGRGDQFEKLKPWLVGDLPGVSQSETAAQLGLSESAAKVAVHRLRKRFGQIVREQIAETLRDPSQAEEELSHLRAALG